MRRDRHGGFQELNEHFLVVAIHVILAAILLPVCEQAVRQAARHNHTPPAPDLHVRVFFLAVYVSLFVLFPIVLALLYAAVLKFILRRTENFVELAYGFYGSATVGVFAAVGIAGIALLLWNTLIIHIVHYVRL